jgi:hypothetical protein
MMPPSGDAAAPGRFLWRSPDQSNRLQQTEPNMLREGDRVLAGLDRRSDQVAGAEMACASHSGLHCNNPGEWPHC